jgi:hypothetical protein
MVESNHRTRIDLANDNLLLYRLDVPCFDNVCHEESTD